MKIVVTAEELCALSARTTRTILLIITIVVIVSAGQM
jgi:hypothetical protein